MIYRFLAALVFVFLVGCLNKKPDDRSLLSYVPDNASLVIQITDYEAFKSTITNNDFISTFNKTNAYQNILEKVTFLKYLDPKSESILSLTAVDTINFDFTFTTIDENTLFNLDSLKNSTVETITQKDITFKRYSISEKVFFSTVLDDKVIVSSSKSLLKQVSKTKATEPNKLLQKLYNTRNTSKPASILVNLNRIDHFLKPNYNKRSKINLSAFSDWISLDLDLDYNNLHLSGISIVNDSTPKYITILENTKPETNLTPFFAPANADAILSYTFNDFASFSANRERLTNLTSKKLPSLNAIQEIGIIYFNEEKSILLNTFGSKAIVDYLKKNKTSSIEFQGNEILELQNPDFLNTRFSPLIKNFKANYCTILKNAYVFSENSITLQKIIKNYKNGNTFNTIEVFKNLENEIAKESSILFIANSKKINQILKTNFSNSFVKDLDKLVSSDYAYAAQIIIDKNFSHTNIVAQKIKSVRRKKGPSTLFSITLPAAISTNPQFVTNHLDKKKELLVQDVKNVLYLISSTGKILWKKQLKGAIQGEIHQVDIFKNDRLQYAFTTDNQLLVLDRNGKEVKQFTKTYEGGNLNSLAVFDYENNKDYRFVVTQNNRTYMYDNKAKIVSGFKFTEASQAIITSPKHIRIGNKDFLIYQLKNGKLKILSRTGENRIKVNEKIDFSNNEVFNYKNQFILTDKNGVLYKIDKKGKITKKSLNLSNDHGIYATKRTLATINESTLRIKSKSVALEIAVYTPPKIFYLKDKIYVSITDVQNGKVYLFDSQAKPIFKKPLDGFSSIDLQDIENDNTLEIATKLNKNTIIVYSLN